MIAGERFASASTSGWPLRGRKLCTKVGNVSLSRRWDSAAIVSNTSDDFPEPETPVKTVILRRGMSTEMFCRLFSRAPRTWMTPKRSDSKDEGDMLLLTIAVQVAHGELVRRGGACRDDFTNCNQCPVVRSQDRCLYDLPCDLQRRRRRLARQG